MANIRFATAADIPALVELGRLMRDESPRYRDRQYAPEKVERLAKVILKTDLLSPSDWILVVAEELGRLVGMMVGTVAEDFFGYDKFAAELVLFIRPENRRGSIAMKMVDLYQSRARELGAIEAELTVNSAVHPERTSKLYERIGYTLTGYSHVKRL